MYCLGECIRFVSVLVSPVLTRTPSKIREQLGIDDPNLTTWESLGEFGKLPSGVSVRRKQVIFPRLDIQAELAELSENKENGGVQVENTAEKEVRQPEIEIEHFKALDLRVALVKEAERVPKSDKLLKLTLKVGNSTRQVVAGIAKEYAPEDIIGKSIILLANLKPAKLRGVLSEGMLMAASDDEGKLSLLTVDRPIADGSKIS
jgi:methionyl-tRNA synthetase